MILIAYAFWVCLVILFCFRLAVRGDRSSRVRDAFCTALAIALILVPYWDVLAGVTAMRRLCDDEGGFKRHESVSLPLSSVALMHPDGPVNLCMPCYVILIRGHALETQTEIRLGAYASSNAKSLTDRSGPMRYRLMSSGAAECSLFDAAFDEDSRKSLWRLAGASYDGSSCIAGFPSDAVSARFELTYPTLSERREGMAVVQERAVVLRHTDEPRPIATLKHLRQWPWTARRFGAHAALPPVPNCPSVDSPIPVWLTPEFLLQAVAGQVAAREVSP